MTPSACARRNPTAKLALFVWPVALPVGMALAYNLRLKVLPLSVVPYAVAFGLLPVAVTLGEPSPPT